MEMVLLQKLEDINVEMINMGTSSFHPMLLINPPACAQPGLCRIDSLGHILQLAKARNRKLGSVGPERFAPLLLLTALAKGTESAQENTQHARRGRGGDEAEGGKKRLILIRTTSMEPEGGTRLHQEMRSRCGRHTGASVDHTRHLRLVRGAHQVRVNISGVGQQLGLPGERVS
ncbi:hypothetical protein EYF80_014095 [Liparis tanakae]|uniref:Uncharacterized protein n=1 Tax=Liparis tanakae TaxID=230148 RepID=A0A4Z2IEH7_9TELE|nr:hypothetical protein EYF80_014095 [Liparis tanakae]